MINKILTLVLIINSMLELALGEEFGVKKLINPDRQAKSNLEIKKLKQTNKWFHTNNFYESPELLNEEVLSSSNNEFNIKRFDEPRLEFIDDNKEVEGNFMQQAGDLNTLATNFDGGISKNERMEFHVHGHLGPKTYKWGFDTGEGKNRQMRFEEMDAKGLLKGHFGYYNKDGKFEMVHYIADPKEGFHVE